MKPLLTNPLFFFFFWLILAGLVFSLFRLWRVNRQLTVELAESRKPAELKDILDLVRAIPDLKRVEASLQKKDRLLQAVVEATYEIISNSQLETAIGKVIALLGNAMQLDRVNIYSHAAEAGGAAFIDQLASWDADSDTVEYYQRAMQHIPAALVPFALGVLGRNEIYARPVSGLEDPVLRGLLERRKVKSLVCLPFFVAGQFDGFVTFNDCHRERDWTPTELSILQSFGVTLGVVMERSGR